MTALDTMKAAVQCAKTEAAKLRIRVRQLEEKLVEAAAVSEREADALRAGADVLVAENARLKKEVERLTRRLHDEGGISKTARERVRELEELNTPLKEALAAAQKDASDWKERALGHARSLRATEDRLAAVEYVDACPECGGPDDHVHVPESPPAVDGTTSDKNAVRNLPHPFIPAPFYPDKCDATLDDRGRQRTCARPRAEHTT